MNWTERFTEAKKYIPAALGVAGLAAESIVAPVLGKFMFVDRTPDPLPAPIPRVDTQFSTGCDYKPGINHQVPAVALLIENLLSNHGPDNEVSVYMGTLTRYGEEKQRLSLVAKVPVTDYIPLYWLQSAPVVNNDYAVGLNPGEVAQVMVKIGPVVRFGIGPVEDVDMKAAIIPGCTYGAIQSFAKGNIIPGLLLP